MTYKTRELVQGIPKTLQVYDARHSTKQSVQHYIPGEDPARLKSYEVLRAQRLI